MSRAMASLTPAWVSNKQAYLTEFNGMYPYLAAVDTAIEDSGDVGHYTPLAGDTLPANAAGAGSITADPLTAWDTGSHVNGLTGDIYWDSSAWQDGVAP